MKKKVLFIIVILICLYALFKTSGVLRTYTIPSSSSEPNLKVGSRIIGSSLKKSKRLDFVYFKFSDSLDGWTIVKRLIAIPGDTLECRNGNYFVNSNNIDKEINLRFAYKMLPDIYNKYIKDTVLDAEAYSHYSNDTIRVFLNNSFVESLPVKLDRYIYFNEDNLSPDIFLNHPDWTINDFGPIVIPSRKYFLSGDNRDNSIDSRYRGFVNKEHILGTVLMNF
jgi:signal peptidase I